MATVFAQDSLTITQHPPTEIPVDTLTFQLPPTTIQCNGMCNGRFQTYFILSESLSEYNKREHSCYITQPGESCTFQPEFKVFRWSKWPATILIKAVSEPSMTQPAVEVKGQKITIERVGGTLRGTVKKIGEQTQVTFTCQDALCMGVKLSVTGSAEEFDCKDLDKNSEPCTAIFEI